MRSRSKHSLRAVPTNLSANAFALGRTGVFMILVPSARKTWSKLAVNFVSRSRTRNLTRMGALGEQQAQVAGLLRYPLPHWWAGPRPPLAVACLRNVS
jgi:hypothetical protein